MRGNASRHCGTSRGHCTFPVRLLVAATVAVGFLASACAPHRPPSLPFSVTGVEPLPALSTSAQAEGRDGGSTALVGNRIVWLFGDTFVGDDDLLCATAAWSSPTEPTQLEEATDAKGAPLQLYRYTPAEQAFNAAHADPPACCEQWSTCSDAQPRCHCPVNTDCTVRIALWPGDPVARPDGSVIGYYESVIAGVAPYDLMRVATGIATLPAGSTVAKRARMKDDDDEPLMLFDSSEPNFLHALAVDEGGQRMLYAYAVTDRVGCKVNVIVARVPLEHAGERAAYRFWNGQAWVPDVNEAHPVLADVTGGLGSVAWNDYLGAYLSGFSDVCSGGSHFLMRTAPRPEGPWSKPVEIDLSPLGAGPNAYAGRLHPALNSGKRVVISFYQPEIGDDGGPVGRVHLVAVDLR
jgi:hypothetical protein